MPTLEPGLDRLIRSAVDNRLLDVHTCTVGKVQSVTGTPPKTADVQILCRRPVQNENDETVYENSPVLPAVPILWPGAHGIAYPLDLQPGDMGLILFTEDDTGDAWDQRSTVEPSNVERHGMTASYFLPVAGVNAVPASDYAALASVVQSTLTSIIQWLVSHTHAGVTAGTGVSGTSTLAPPTNPSVAATVTRAK